LDELPNVVNVFRHEMSVVGPRPNVPWEVEVYRDWHTERLRVLPGITGLAQVRGRSDIPFDTIVQHDLEYIRRQSFGLDLNILWKTFARVVKRSGAG
jgi:lipopolysaccharide/colanic/teichoic acid biosynthesis glycosyltransferase